MLMLLFFFTTSLAVGQLIPLKEVASSGFQTFSIALMGREGEGEMGRSWPVHLTRPYNSTSKYHKRILRKYSFVFPPGAELTEDASRYTSTQPQAEEICLGDFTS